MGFPPRRKIQLQLPGCWVVQGWACLGKLTLLLGWEGTIDSRWCIDVSMISHSSLDRRFHVWGFDRESWLVSVVSKNTYVCMRTTAIVCKRLLMCAWVLMSACEPWVLMSACGAPTVGTGVVPCSCTTTVTSSCSTAGVAVPRSHPRPCKLGTKWGAGWYLISATEVHKPHWK